MSKHRIVASEDAPTFRGQVLVFWHSKQHEVILSGPYDCVAGDTLILDPISGTETPIRVLAERGNPITVLTRNGPRQATCPFLKGRAPLYKVTTTDGSSFTATAKHQVLTTEGWYPVSEVLGRTLMRILPQSSSVPDPAMSQLNVRHWSEIPVGCQDDCFVCRHQHDEPLHPESKGGQVCVPSQGDVLERSCGGPCLDDHGTIQGHSHLYRSRGHPSTVRYAPLLGAGFHRVCHDSVESHEQFGVLNQVFGPFLEGSIRQRSIVSNGEYQKFSPASLSTFLDLYRYQACCYYTVTKCPVSSVEYVGMEFYYDMHVPFEEHYYAQGFFHHNTGKTFATLSKLHLLLCLFPKARALMVRKTRNSILSSAVVTYEKKVLPFPPEDPRCPIRKYGGERPEFYVYPNGSRLIIGGLDDADKYLSAEYDFIYVNQAEEITLDAWEKLVGRASGRAGNAPWTQVMGDCNPSFPKHWIKQRAALQFLETRHEDNPSLHDGTDWTQEGRKRIAILDGLSGLRYKRGRLGLWVGAEGVVYEFDSMVHLLPRFEIPASWRRFRVIDFGYSNPFVCLWIALDSDGRMYVYRELYMTQRTVARHLVDIHYHSHGESYMVTISDHDAEDRATLAAGTIVDDPTLVAKLAEIGFVSDDANHVKLPGIGTVNADKRVSVGIQKVEERLKVRDDGRPRLFVLEDSLIETDESLKENFLPLCTEDEFMVYAWPEDKAGKPVKEEPLKIYDHAMDALRYGVMYFDGGATKPIPLVQGKAKVKFQHVAN